MKNSPDKELLENIQNIINMEEACAICEKYVEKFGLPEIEITDSFNNTYNENDLHKTLLEYFKDESLFSELIDYEHLKARKGIKADASKDEKAEFIGYAKNVVSYKESCNYISVLLQNNGILFFSEMEDFYQYNTFMEILIKVSENLEQQGKNDLANAFRTKLMSDLLEYKKFNVIQNYNLLD